jgi:hypothetical protein
MKTSLLRALTVSTLALAVTLSAHAAKDADLKPVSAKPGKVIAEDTFASDKLAETWKLAKGDTAVKDGALTLSFKESDHHPAVLMLGVPNHNSIIKFSFKMEDAAKGFNLSYNSAAGHLFRVLVTGDGFTAVKDVEKDKSAKKAKGKAKAASTPVKTAAAAKGEAKAKGKGKDKEGPIAKAEGKIAAGEWHTMLVEVQGTKLAVQIDGLKAEGSHPEIDVDKNGYRFVTGGAVSLDDVKAWAVE